MDRHSSRERRKVLVAGTLNGDVYKVNLTTGKKEGPFKVGEKFCGAIVGPDGKMYFEDMADGNVYVWDTKTLKTVDKMPVGKAVCGIQWTNNNKKAYITDMPTGDCIRLRLEDQEGRSNRSPALR